MMKKAIVLIFITLFSTQVFAWNNYQCRCYNPKDPLEGINRPITKFNDFIDKAILTPVAKSYMVVVPKPIVKGINNVFNNIDNVPTVANDVLQGNIHQAASDSWRLIINSTVGIAGFFDVATSMGLESNAEDLGLTFARWGYKDSAYFVLPFFGPSTIRDAIALPINYQFLTVYPYLRPVNYRYRLYALGVVSRRAELLHLQNVLEQASVDRYAFLRDAYLQHRAYQMQRNINLSNACCRQKMHETVTDDDDDDDDDG